MPKPPQLLFHFNLLEGLSLTWDPESNRGAMLWQRGPNLPEMQWPFLVDSPQEFAQSVVNNHDLNPPSKVAAFLRQFFDVEKSQDSARDFEELILDKVDIRKLKRPQ